MDPLREKFGREVAGELESRRQRLELVRRRREEESRRNADAAEVNSDSSEKEESEGSTVVPEFRALGPSTA